LLKTGPGFQNILNIITVASSADAGADPKFQNPHISGVYVLRYVKVLAL